MTAPAAASLPAEGADPAVTASAATGARRAERLLAGLLRHGVLLSWVATVYVLVVVADSLGPTDAGIHWWAHVVAVALVAVTLEPVRRWLRVAVDDVVHGHHDDAYDVMTSVHRELDRPSLAATIARTLNVSYVSIVEGDRETSAVGRRPRPGDLADFPLAYGGEQLGHLYVAARHAGEPLSRGDVRLLGDLAHQIEVAMFAVRASTQVQASRAALVTAREEERRRIRRDLHDGLGPTLASLKMQLAAVQRLLGTDPDRAAAMIRDLRADVDGTTAEIRRLVYGLRPPLIDELGLLAALRNHPASQAGMEVVIDADDVSALPAAVEVAVYRIAAEALHNAVRHSGGRRCEVELRVRDDALHLSVRDDGRGAPDPLVEGVGLSAMRERAAELGGTLTLGRVAGRGLRLDTVLPLACADQHGMPGTP